MTETIEVLMKYMIWIILLVVAANIIVYLLRRLKAKAKGVEGEALVSIILKKLPADQYIPIHNVMLPTSKGTTQIDHVVVSKYGIFVIETKNYAGWIMGSENGDKWMQSIYGSRKQFMNPIHQNFGHIKTLQTLLPQVPEDAFFSIVCFPGDSKIKVNASHTPVVYYSQLEKIIRSHTDEKIATDDLEKITQAIQNANVDSHENRKKHIENINTEKQEKADQVKAGICPRCGGKLVLRHGKYGDFYGCENFPKCRYTSKI